MKIFRRFLLAGLSILLLVCLILVSMAVFAPSNAKHSTSLAVARAGFSTLLIPHRIKADGKPEQPPPDIFRLIHYSSPAGKLAAYITPPPDDARVKRPALIWLKGGWGGIGSFLWDTESGQDPTAFRKAGFVVMCPSFRGENDNPGKMEAFFGEVDDVLAAIQYIEQLPYVDSRRIYIAGHSTGGTLATLTAMTTDKPRAVFSFGGRLDTKGYVRLKGILGAMPFNWLNSTEIRLRNPIEFVSSIRVPLYYFEGEEYAESEEYALMQRRADSFRKPYTGYIVRRADHFNYLQIATYWLANTLQQDRGEKFSASIQPNVLQRLFDTAMEKSVN
jgi:pimeloyl-ACP methyl ester carboxylesterase